MLSINDYRPYLAVVLLYLTLLGLNQIEDMSLYSVMPLIVAKGAFLTSILFMSRDLLIPLWFSKQLIKWAGVSAIFLVFVGYTQMHASFQNDEMRKMMLNYQTKCD